MLLRKKIIPTKQDKDIILDDRLYCFKQKMIDIAHNKNSVILLSKALSKLIKNNKF